jgi:phenylacetate-CoA ligase
MIVVRGVNVFPAAVEEILQSFSGVAEYQVRVTAGAGLTELSLHIEPKPDCMDVPGLLAQVEKIFQTRFALRVPVVAMPGGSLPRFEMKARRWVRTP